MVGLQRRARRRVRGRAAGEVDYGQRRPRGGVGRVEV